MGDDYDDIVPEKEVIEVGKEKLEITELSIKQTIELSRFLSKKFFDVTKGIADVELKELSINDLLDIIIRNLDEESLLSLLVIVTSKDREWWKKNFKLSAALKVIRKVLEGEDIGEVFTESLQIVNMFQKIMLSQAKKS